jgi:hypothetical protein
MGFSRSLELKNLDIQSFILQNHSILSSADISKLTKLEANQNQLNFREEDQMKAIIDANVIIFIILF